MEYVSGRRMGRLVRQKMLRTAYMQAGAVKNAVDGVWAIHRAEGKYSLPGEPLFSGFFMLSDETCRSQDKACQDRQNADDYIVNLISHEDALRTEVEQALRIP
mgnify:FL=1